MTLKIIQFRWVYKIALPCDFALLRKRESPLTSPTTMTPPHDPETWVDLYGDALYSYAFFRTKDRDAASEAVQETFLRALRKLSTFENRSSIKTWLTGILRNVLFEKSRQDKRQAREFSTDHEPSLTLAELQTLPPDEAIQRTEFWETVETCLAKLPTKAAKIFWASEVERRPARDLAQELETSPNNISAQLYRARKFMRECINFLLKK